MRLRSLTGRVRPKGLLGKLSDLLGIFLFGSSSYENERYAKSRRHPRS